MSMRKTTLVPGVTFAFCSHGEKLPRQGGLRKSNEKVM